jgi:CBS domain containing-hemolysin-like protein
MQMEDDPNTQYPAVLVTLVVLFSLSVFFALCETSFSSANRTRLRNIAEKDKSLKKARRARLVLKLLDSYDAILSTILIGNTIVNVVTSALATALFMDMFGVRGIPIASVTVTILVLIFGEISPKTLAKESPERVALKAAPFLKFFTFAFLPLNYLTRAWKKVIVKIFPVKSEKAVTEEELLTFVGEVREEGGINSEEERMIRQVIEFDDITAAEIMTPRIDLCSVCENESPEKIDALFAKTGFSRLPLYKENVDNITGIILFKDFHYEVLKNGKSISEIAKPVIFVSKTIKISKLLKALREKKTHLAVLIDEFGSALGIVTVEDIMEELVGEIWDEHDRVVEPLRVNEDLSFQALGSVHLHELQNFIAEKAGIDFSRAINAINIEENTANTTIANWIMEHCDGYPRKGDCFEWGPLRLTVFRVQRHRIMEVTLTILE